MIEGNACIFHPRIRALQAYQVKDTKTGLYYRYGLCPICNNRLKKEDSFKQQISARLEELAYKLQKQEEGKCKKQQ